MLFLNSYHRQLFKIQQNIEITDATWHEELLKTRYKLMRYGFQTKLVGHLFALLIWKWKLSIDITWPAFLLIKGYAIENNKETELVMLLCACTVALAGKQVHWVVADEQRVGKLINKYTVLVQMLGIEIADSQSDITVLTSETSALNYLKTENSHLKRLLNGSIPNSTDFALIENIDFWLFEKAFAVVDNDNEQIMLHELFLCYKCLAGSLLGLPNKKLKQVYNVIPTTLFKHKIQPPNISFFQNEEQKWQAIADLLTDKQKICLVATSTKSLDNIHSLIKKMTLSVTIVKNIQDDFTGNLVILADSFPWLKLTEWLQGSSYQIIVVDFYASSRVLHSLKKMPVSMLFSLEDKWLQELKIPFLLIQLLKIRKITGRIAHWLLKHLIIQIEKKQMKLHKEMARWLEKL